MPTRRRALLVILLLALLGLASLVIALAAGSLPVSAADIGRALFGDTEGVAAEVVRSLRLPRALAAFACGALLALSVIVDHYDERDNEHRYRAFARHARRLGFALFFAALAWDLVARLGAPDG